MFLCVSIHVVILYFNPNPTKHKNIQNKLEPDTVTITTNEKKIANK